MKDGVEYVLRFGDIYRGSEEDENATGDSRYIYAFARVNEQLLEQPSMEAVPAPLVEEKPAPAEKEDAQEEAKPAEEEGKQGPEGDEGEQAPPPPASPPGPPPNFTPPSPPPGIAPPPPPTAQDSVAVEAPTGDANASSAGEESEFAKRKADRDAEIARIQAANATKRQEFKNKVAEAQKRVDELNQELAGWYYVISNEVYEKIRLERKDFVQAKEPEEGEKPEEVKASHILISYKGADRADAQVTRSKEEAKEEAERIRRQIVEDGEDFALLAAKHSDGPSKTKGGDLGKFKFEVMAKPFSEAAFALEVGAVSEVVETGFGFHVIKRTE
ncbi:MAG: peptidylprolyl isomerase, partial [Verrucomicrobiota bacterium]|nr:peptidylprolyl isomerase [Verrucomicrobiota bacterium]